MSEFKGTKGEWKYEGGDNNSIDIILPDDTTISIDRQSRYNGEYVLGREGMEANAKLIACAPEMLEMLIKLNGFCTMGKDDRIELEQLIKKATE